MKKVFVIILSAVMMLGLVACGASDTPVELDALIKDIAGHGGSATYLNEEVVVVAYPRGAIGKVEERANEIGSEFAKTDRDVLILVAMNEDGSVYWGISVDKYNTDGASEFGTEEWGNDYGESAKLRKIVKEASDKSTVVSVSDNLVQITVPLGEMEKISEVMDEIIAEFHKTNYNTLAILNIMDSGEVFAGNIITQDGKITQIENTTYLSGE